MSFYFYSSDRKKFPTLTEAKCPADVPKGFHYAVIIFDSTSVYIPRDENGYHGGTEHYNTFHGGTEHYNTFQYFFTKDSNELNSFVKFLYNDDSNKNKFIFFPVSGLGKVNIDVSISCDNIISD